jgi:hypothetical protein
VCFTYIGRLVLLGASISTACWTSPDHCTVESLVVTVVALSICFLVISLPYPCPLTCHRCRPSCHKRPVPFPEMPQSALPGIYIGLRLTPPRLLQPSEQTCRFSSPWSSVESPIFRLCRQTSVFMSLVGLRCLSRSSLRADEVAEGAPTHLCHRH